MRDRFHFAFFQHECGFQQSFAIACGTAGNDPGAFGHLTVDLFDRTDGRIDRGAVVIAVKRIQELSVFGYEGKFCRCGTCVYAQVAVAPVGGQRGGLYSVGCMSLGKRRILFTGGEEGFHAVDLELQTDLAREFFFQPVQRDMALFMRVHRAADGCEQMGVLYVDDMLVIQFKCPDERRLKFCQKVQRTAEKRNMAPDRFAAGQTGDGLDNDCLEDGSGQVFPGGTFIDQRLDIGFREDTASCGYSVKRAVGFCVFVKSLGIGLEQGGHLVYE